VFHYWIFVFLFGLASLASAGAPPPLGAHTGPDGPTTFALYAPGKTSVHWIGDFNKWGEDPILLEETSLGVWVVSLDLPPGPHAYQYLVNEELRLADPYARDIQWNRPDGEKGWLPEEALSIVHVGQTDFPWKTKDFTRPSLDALIIYELYVHDFAPQEGIQGITDRLEYIADLGVTTIQLMPWHPFPGMESWGYNPAYHFAVEQTYGTAEDLKRLIDESHRLGLAVIMDMVLNHAEWGSSLYRLYGNRYDLNPYFKAFDGHNWGFPKIDQESAAVKRWTADVIRYWIQAFNIDGFRYDATRWTGWSGYNDWGASWYAYVAKQEDPSSIQIAEHLPIEPELIIQTEMDTGWHAEYRWHIREMIRTGQFNKETLHDMLDARRVGFDSSHQRMVYTESHDEERVWRELAEAGYTGEALWRRAVMALAIPLTSPGPVMIYAGQEFGERTAKNVGWNPLNWSLLVSRDGRRLHEATRQLIKLRRDHPALRSTDVNLLEANEETGVAVYTRGLPDNQLLVVFNAGLEPASISAGSAVDLDSWHLIFSNGNTDLGCARTIDAGEIRVYSSCEPAS